MTSGPETIQISVPPPQVAADPLAGPVSDSGRMEAWLWRAIPVAILLAAWLPALWMALGQIGPVVWTEADGEPVGIRQTILAWVGPPGLTLLAPLFSGTMLLGTWMLSRALGAPRWGAAIVGSVAVAAHVIGLAPSPVDQPADAAFAGAMLLTAAFTARAVAAERQAPMAWAFVFAVVACWVRPWAAWPALAVLVSIVLVTRVFEERPWCGAIAASAWGPGFWLAKLFGESGGFGSTLFAAPAAGGGALQAGIGSGVELARTLPDQLMGLLQVLLQALPFVVLGLLAVGGVALCLVLGGARRKAALSMAVFAGFCVFGAIGYGDLVAARLLLDPLFLALAAGAAVALPVLLRRQAGRPE